MGSDAYSFGRANGQVELALLNEKAAQLGTRRAPELEVQRMARLRRVVDFVDPFDGRTEVGFRFGSQAERTCCEMTGRASTDGLTKATAAKSPRTRERVVQVP
jgi:hypothetical protein